LTAEKYVQAHLILIGIFFPNLLLLMYGYCGELIQPNFGYPS